MRNKKTAAVEVCCRNIGSLWIGSFRNAFSTARVFSPYLTDSLAAKVLATDEPSNIEVYTRFDIEAFAAGASSLKVLRRLSKNGYPLFELHGLHAKIVEHPLFASVGSQNLTRRGTLNREASVVVRDPEIRADLSRQLAEWIKHRRPITLEMIAHAEQLMPVLERKARELHRLCTEAKAAIVAQEEARDRLAETARAAAQQRLISYQRARDSWMNQLNCVGPDSARLCRIMIVHCAQWYRQGQFVSASGHARNLIQGPWGWELPLGENRFLVELALKTAGRLVAAWFPSTTVREFEFDDTERELLVRALRGCVALHRDRLDSCYRMDKDERLVFGTQFINLRYFISAIEYRATHPL